MLLLSSVGKKIIQIRFHKKPFGYLLSCAGSNLWQGFHLFLNVWLVPPNSYHDSSQSFSGNEWHHLVLKWDVISGNWSFLVNNKPGFNVFGPPRTTPYPGGHLVVGQSQNSSGAVEKAESLRADIMEFNTWDYKLTDETIHDLYTSCSIRLGSLIAWPEAQIRLHGEVKRVEFVRCKIEGIFIYLFLLIN